VTVRTLSLVTATALALIAAPAAFAHDHKHAHDDAAHDHDHGHDHAHDHDDAIYKGYFEDAQVKDRSLADWQGAWQSVYPLLLDGSLDPVMAHKAEAGGKDAGEYRAYYETGYRTDVEWIEIAGNKVTFFRKGSPVSAEYAADGYEILTYEKGNRGVRFNFEKASGDAEAPQFIQFSDHIIAPQVSGHFHLYWGDDRAALLKEVTNWPTYYPGKLTGAQIAEEMMAH
jgi:zinc transport system substrate-binding protein